jgi:uncharacterized protein YndB with AHSA1/START domain
LNHYPAIVFALLYTAAEPAAAEVVAASSTGFLVEQEVVIAAERADVWRAAVDEVGSWWSDQLTISGDASRLSIEARPMGCFCESLGGDDGIAHLVVTSVSSNVMLRLSGGLGPLGLMGVSGNMTWEFFDADEGTRVRFSYAVGGFSPDGLDNLAEPVDAVIGDALGLLQAHVESSRDD